MNQPLYRIAALAVLTCAFFASGFRGAFAGGPFQVTEGGEPSVWEMPITLHPESGTCATFSNSAMVTKIGQNIAHWENVTGVDLDFTVTTGTIAEDVDGDNYNDYFVDTTADPGATDSINPVVFDNDGDIVNDIFGSTCGQNCQYTVLGFAGPDVFTGNLSTILDGQAFFNCRCLVGNPNGACTVGNTAVVFTEDDLDFTMTHEVGHMIGLDHTQVNASLASGCDENVAGDCDDLPAMYPVSVDAEDQISPQRDDEVALLTLYGLTTLTNSSCTVTGTILDADGDELRCADIQARTGDTADTIAVVSGVFAPNRDLDNDNYTDGDGECLSDCGDFTLRGLDPTKTYTISVRPINAAFTGGSGIGPCTNEQNSGVVTETITTIDAGDCSAGATQSLGTVSTLSTGGSSGGSGGSGGAGCGLSAAPGSLALPAVAGLLAAFIGAVWAARAGKHTHTDA